MDNEFKRVVFDLDGTLCFDGVKINNSILNSITNMYNVGFEVIFASARPIRDIYPLLPIKFHDFDMIGGNGSIIKKNNEIFTEFIPEVIVNEIFKIIDRNNVKVLVDGSFNYHYNGDENLELKKRVDTNNIAMNIPRTEIENVIKIAILDSDESSSIYQEVSKIDGIKMNNYKNENFFDIVLADINKKTTLFKYFGETPYIAFGNDVNDIELLVSASIGYIVGNNQELKILSNCSFINSLQVHEAINQLFINQVL